MMKALTVSAVLLLLAITVAGLRENCPDGGEIFERGISGMGKSFVVGEHNRLRRKILYGHVPGQPRGKNINMVKYDEELGYLAKEVSKRCEMKHRVGSHSQYGQVGQNLYISYSSEYGCEQKWPEVIDAWYHEHRNYKYPGPGSTGVTGHYTQVIWHSTEAIGCDFICYYDKSQPHYPYTKLYTCNYGPAGNMMNEPPYEKADDA